MGDSDEHIYFRTSSELFDLTEGTGGGGDTGDSIMILWEAIFEDTIAVPEDLWTWSLSDSAQFETGKKYFPWYYPGPDSMHVDSAVAICPTGSPNFTWNYYWASDISGADTDAFSSAQTVSGADATSTGEWDIPDNANIPPGVFIWFDFGALTTKPPNGVSFTIKGTYY
jgi:hypothetical protein